MSLRPSRSFRQSSRVIRLHLARVFWKSASMSAAAGVRYISAAHSKWRYKLR